MKKSNFNAAKEYVFNRLENELPDNLYYHGFHHTRDYVLPDSEILGKMENISKEDFLLLRTAALYHDTGFIEEYKKNEPIGKRIAEDSLPKFGYSNDQIDRIGKIIMATQMQIVGEELKQVPDKNDHLQKIMCDADLFYLGGDSSEFIIISDNLRREMKEYGIPDKNPEEWDLGQPSFLESHSYFTDSAKNLRNKGKERNINASKKLKRILLSLD
jgi:predicted metal-dependent HD superfamily phosphohydrolase